jgi:hypothetical protein
VPAHGYAGYLPGASVIADNQTQVMRILLAFTLAACTAATMGWGQQTQQSRSSVSSLLGKLQSKDWTERSDALDKIRFDPAALHSARIQKALVDLLEQEYGEDDKKSGKTQDGVSLQQDEDEGYAEYTSWLAETVSSFADWNDPRQVCLLVKAATVLYPSSPVEAAIRAKAAMPCILKRAIDHDPVERDVAIPMLVEALAKGKDALDSKTVQTAKQIIVNDLRDSDAGVRGGTVVALGNYGGTDMIPALQGIARSDPASDKRDDGSEWFPIRRSAAEALEEIRKRAGQ